jgi:hypothetical protein
MLSGTVESTRGDVDAGVAMLGSVWLAATRAARCFAASLVCLDDNPALERPCHAMSAVNNPAAATDPAIHGRRRAKFDSDVIEEDFGVGAASGLTTSPEVRESGIGLCGSLICGLEWLAVRASDVILSRIASAFILGIDSRCAYSISMDAKRSLGVLDSIRLIRVARLVGQSARNDLTSGALSNRCPRRTAGTLSPLNGRTPVSNSNATQPSEY